MTDRPDPGGEMDLERSGDEGMAHLVRGDPASPPSAALASITTRVVVGYAIAATAWIVGTDLLVSSLGDGELPAASLAKGLLFVGVTSAVLWVVLHALTDRFDQLFTRTVTQQRDFYGSILATSSDIVAILGADGRTVFVNDAVTEGLGWLPVEMTGRTGREFVHPTDRPAAMSFAEGVGATGDQVQRTFLLRHRDGSFRAMEVRGARIRLADGEHGLVLNARDVTDRARSERQLRAALAEDTTGLPGLRMFMAEMEGIGELRPGGLRATVAIVDVDRFGDVNELHGRHGGDEVLRELARRLEAAMPAALGVWRHGADEFVVVLLDDAHGDAVEAQAVAERIRSIADSPVLLAEGGVRVAVDVSVGVARVDLGGEPQHDPLGTVLLRSAEAALHDAKRHPDRMAVRRSGSATTTADRARQVAELHDALERDELVVHYQPKVRLADLSVAGVEALVRWQHPVRGLVPPGDFLGAVAEANLSSAVLDVVLRDALGRAERWTQAPGCVSDFMICVNVSADDLRRRRFVADVASALDAAGLDAERLCLELTEQVVLADPTSARAVVDELRRTGVQVAIDDFGTGYSTLAHIRMFEVDEVKIDKSFVQHLGDSAADEAIVDSVLAIGQRLGVRVVAEGIEHGAALAYLRERGCAFGQGYLFSRAVPGEEIDPAGIFLSTG